MFPCSFTAPWFFLPGISLSLLISSLRPPQFCLCQQQQQQQHGPLLVVYIAHARLVTECNVVLVCLLPHQLQLLASQLRVLSPVCAPSTQVFFCLASAQSMQALRTHLGFC